MWTYQKKFVGGLPKWLGGMGHELSLGRETQLESLSLEKAVGRSCCCLQLPVGMGRTRGGQTLVRGFCTLRSESQWTQTETQATPSTSMGKLFMEALSLELIQHLTGQHLEQSALLGIALSRVLDLWTPPPEIFPNPSYSMNLKMLLNLYQYRTISWCVYDFQSKI